MIRHNQLNPILSIQHDPAYISVVNALQGRDLRTGSHLSDLDEETAKKVASVAYAGQSR